MTQFFRKIYLWLYWKGCVLEGVGDRTELQHIEPHLYGHNSVSFPFFWAAQPGAWGPSLSGTWSSFQHLLSNSNCSIGAWVPPLLGAGFLYRISSPTNPISNWLTSCLYPGYIIVRRPPSFCGRHKSHSIQPIHGQGYILIFLDWMHLLFTRIHFLFWLLGRVGGQYAASVRVSLRVCAFMHTLVYRKISSGLRAALCS